MDCLTCNNKVQFESHHLLLEDHKLSSTFCQLLDIRPNAFDQIFKSSSSSSVICPDCSGRLLEIHGLLQELEVIKVKLDYFRSQIIEDMAKGQGANVIEERSKIIKEIRSKVDEKLNDNLPAMSKSRDFENLDNSIQNLFEESSFFDNFDNGIDTDPDMDFTLELKPKLPTMGIKNAQIILERIQLPLLESIDIDFVTKNSFNITQEPIASFISRNQLKFNLKKPFLKSPEIKRRRGRPKKFMRKSTKNVKNRVGRPSKKIKPQLDENEKIDFKRNKILKQISNRKYNKKTKILCSNCGLRLPRISALIEHQRIHTGELPFKCDICGKGYRAKRLLISHQTIHGIGASSGQCSICGIYMAKSGLKTHLERHEGVKNHLCDVCAMSFTTFDSLKKHRARHLNLKPKVNCPHCEKVYHRKSTLREHILKHHEKKFDVSCPDCKKTFINKTRMNFHRKNVHFKDLIVKEKACQFCENLFKNNFYLNNHVMIHHTKDFPFKCTVDGCKSRGFVNKHRLARHLLIHSGKIDHICPYCAKGYAVKTSLNTHIKHYCKNRPGNYEEFILPH